jgi:phage terminase small subunit
MPNPRKTTAQLELSGSAQHNRARLKAQGRDNEPAPDPTLGNCPSHLSKELKKIWKEVVSEIPPCVATKSDRKVIEVVVRCVERMRNGTAKSADYATLMRGLSQLGMTPADRSKIQVQQREEGKVSDPFAEFDESTEARQ